MSLDPKALLVELAEEHAALDAMVADRTPEEWLTPTPAEGWTVADTISHLNYFDGTATLSLKDSAAFLEAAQVLLADMFRGEQDVRAARTLTCAELLQLWRDGRAELIAAAAAADPSQRVVWYGPAMSFTSFITARLMETWAHGMDIADAYDLPPVVSSRLKHVCHIGVGARGSSYLVKGLEVPQEPVRVELEAPDGSLWAWNDGSDLVSGTALDFALVVTHRRNLADTDLQLKGAQAQQWLEIAQAFAGPSGSGRAPGARRVVQSS